MVLPGTVQTQKDSLAIRQATRDKVGEQAHAVSASSHVNKCKRRRRRSPSQRVTLGGQGPLSLAERQMRHHSRTICKS